MKGRVKLALLIVVALAAGGGESSAEPPPPVFDDPPLLAVVPFRDLSGHPDAVATVMREVWSRLEQKGFALVGNGRIDDYLRDRRIRARNALSMEETRNIARFMGARYVLVGTIDVWFQNGGPEIGLMARIVDPVSGDLRWVGSVSLHAMQAPGLLAMGRPRTLEEAAPKAVRRLFASLKLARANGDVVPMEKRRRPSRNILARRPVFFRSPELVRGSPLRVAVMPMTNLTRHPEAAAVVSEHVTAGLLALSDVDVVDPGELRRVLIEEDVLALFGATTEQLARLGTALAVDAVVDGTVLEYENKSAASSKIDVFIRLRSVDSGEVLWAATTRRHGNQTHTIYDIGRIAGIDRLARAAVTDLLATWLR